ncbi:UNKNOWN [Stylonychia lemnae]|uniref:Uncharacterized protein n=1 Tax=Stylonychia lemnae TaxID=5949 RepID=A0A078ALS2_STYLE|nr:UNKNOWN [Stylonychia lemnae]|eukprot:CDW83300.1 UNKNOWN [Stylonychia lemnae]
MQSLQKVFARQLISSQRVVTVQFPSAGFAAKDAKEKSTGDEKNFINKQEQEILKNLLKKVSAQNKEAEAEKATRKTTELAELKKLFGDHKATFNDKLGNDLYDWKFN